jgi:hypothetical protein
MTWTRVKDPVTGHEYSTQVVQDGLDVLKDKQAADAYGEPLPPKYNRPLASLTTDDGRKVSDLKVDELRAFAEANQIDLGEASKKDEILAAVVASEQGDGTTPTPAA